jgi:hypothetical protein
MHNNTMLRVFSPHLPLVVGLLAAVIPVGALAELASPREKACHVEATNRYIEDFRRLGAARQEARENVVVFVNDKSNYDMYYGECLSRWNSIKIR